MGFLDWLPIAVVGVPLGAFILIRIWIFMAGGAFLPWNDEYNRRGGKE